MHSKMKSRILRELSGTNQMKSIFYAVALVTTLSTSLPTFASDLRDVKESELTTQQKKEIFSKMSAKEMELIQNYEETVPYKHAVNDTKSPDISYNEKLKFILALQNSK